jgi:hypothetical protein
VQSPVTLDSVLGAAQDLADAMLALDQVLARDSIVCAVSKVTPPSLTLR